MCVLCPFFKGRNASWSSRHDGQAAKFPQIGFLGGLEKPRGGRGGDGASHVHEGRDSVQLSSVMLGGIFIAGL